MNYFPGSVAADAGICRQDFCSVARDQYFCCAVSACLSAIECKYSLQLGNI